MRPGEENLIPGQLKKNKVRFNKCQYYNVKPGTPSPHPSLAGTAKKPDRERRISTPTPARPPDSQNLPLAAPEEGNLGKAPPNPALSAAQAAAWPALGMGALLN